MNAIADDTRPFTSWKVYGNCQDFFDEQLEHFLKGYWRNLMQSQPNHIEIVGEKNTLVKIIKPIAGKYCIPMTLGRGYCSLPPRWNMVQRFKNSGKENLVIVVLSDHDPDGEEISNPLRVQSAMISGFKTSKRSGRD